MTVPFFLSGQPFTALNGGPVFTFNPSVSFYVLGASEAEIDHAWAQLPAGGKAMIPLDRYPWSEKYGWVQDRYGTSWQLSLETPAAAGRARHQGSPASSHSSRPPPCSMASRTAP